MTAETETHVRLATLRLLYRVIADLTATRDLRDTVQAVVDGVVSGLGFGLAAVNLVRPDGDLEVAAVAGSDALRGSISGRLGPRSAWDTLLEDAEPWGPLRFLGHELAHPRIADLPSWVPDLPVGDHPDAWHPRDALLAPLVTPVGDLVGVLSVDGPVDGRRPGPWRCEVLGMFAAQAAIAIDNARLRKDMQLAVARLEHEHHMLRASEESFRQAFEYAPSGMVMTGVGGIVTGTGHGRLLRANDALCRMLGYPETVLRRTGLGALVHPDDRRLLSGHLDAGVPVAGCTELRLARSDGTYRWVSLRTSRVHDGEDGREAAVRPTRFLLTHVEDIEDRRRREEALVHQASHDPLTGLPNGRELRARLAARLTGDVEPAGGPDSGMDSGQESGMDRLDYEAAALLEPAAVLTVGTGVGGAAGETCRVPDAVGEGVEPVAAVAKGLAVLFCDLDGFKRINDDFGHHIGDAVLVEVARRLAAAVRDGDTVARLGGDEFVVLADGITRDEAHDLAVRLRRALSLPIRAEGETVPLDGASFGIGWADAGAGPEELLRTADEQMYVQKRKRDRAHRRAG